MNVKDSLNLRQDGRGLLVQPPVVSALLHASQFKQEFSAQLKALAMSLTPLQ
jgi:hypothetical protein